MTDSRTGEIRKIAQSLFAEGKIELFLGFEQGSLPLRSRPCFVRAGGAGAAGEGAAPGAAGVDRLIWDSFCANNLAAYLPKYYENQPNRPKKRDKPNEIGVAAKACDLRRSSVGEGARSSVKPGGWVCAGHDRHPKLRPQLSAEIMAWEVDADTLAVGP
jgi:hypothetical protein